MNKLISIEEFQKSIRNYNNFTVTGLDGQALHNYFYGQLETVSIIMASQIM